MSDIPAATPAGEKPSKLTTIGILMLINGILNILVGLGVGISFALSLVLICCAPVGILPIVLGVFEILYASKLLSSTSEKVKANSLQIIAICEIAGILILNFVSLALGIVNLVLLNDPEVKEALDQPPAAG